MKIDDWRDEIDRLDEQLVTLLNARSQCAIELGRIKRDLGLAIYSPDREREVIAHVMGINSGPLDRSAVRRLFERIIDESRRIERVTMEKEAKDGNSGKRKKRQK
ncbi:MAG TPA: chorismate mutase [Blastocatellia bacterium]|nr:chorismate mutase [Blastocatellia bacterium]